MQLKAPPKMQLGVYATHVEDVWKICSGLEFHERLI